MELALTLLLSLGTVGLAGYELFKKTPTVVRTAEGYVAV